MDIHKEIGRLPRPKKGFVLPGHKYTGPYNPLDEQLDVNDLPVAGQEPFNAVDTNSMKHDICYRDYKDEKKKLNVCYLLTTNSTYFYSCTLFEILLTTSKNS